MSSRGESNSKATSKSLILSEALTVTILAISSLLVVRPLLEEWLLFSQFNVHGIAYLSPALSHTALRPLHLLPSFMQWLSLGGSPVGVGIIAACLVVTRYFVARWALAPLVSSVALWLCSFLVAVLVGWPALWLARFHPAQLSAIFFILTLGFNLRMMVRPRILWGVGAALSVTAMLMTYQALALVAAAIPISAFFWEFDKNTILAKERLQRVTYIGLSLLLGLGFYVSYVLISKSQMDGSYEGDLIEAASFLSLGNILLSNLVTAFQTVFLSNAMNSFLFITLICGSLWVTRSLSLKSYFVGLLLVLILPAASLVYLSALHVRDPERVLFPVSMAAVLIVVTIFSRSKSLVDARYASLIVAACLASSLSSAYTIRAMWINQKEIILQALDIMRDVEERNFIIEDETGSLGDVYSFLDTALSSALAVMGLPSNVVICTPQAVDRLHPYARRYPIETTADCEDLEYNGRRVLHARISDGSIRLMD